MTMVSQTWGSSVGSIRFVSELPEKDIANLRGPASWVVSELPKKIS